MSRAVSVMTVGSTVPASLNRSGPADPQVLTTRRSTVPLTVPLLCPSRGHRFQLERLHQLLRRLPQRQPSHRRPQVDHVSLLATPRVEAHKDVLLQVHAERLAPRVPPVDRTGAAPLGPAPPQTS